MASKSEQKPQRKNILIGDEAARQAAEDFFAAAQEAVAEFQRRRGDIERGRLSFRIGPSGLGIASTDLLHSEEARLAAACLKRLSKNVVHESDIMSAAWRTFGEFSTRTDKDAPREFASSLLGKLENDADSTPVHRMANHGVLLSDNIRLFDLGRVRICMTEDILPEVTEGNWQVERNGDTFLFRIPHKPLSAMLAGKPDDAVPGSVIAAPEGVVTLTYERRASARIIKGAVLQLEFPQSCWRVTVNALGRNVHEEALWLVNIAISLIRLYFPRLSGGLPPGGFGAVDSHPVLKIEKQQPTITSNTGSISAIGSPPGLHYWIGKAEAEHFKAVGLEAIAEKLYAAAPHTVAERVAQGLGWLSRGRQAESRTERFLFFFTALEALLSSDDKGDPVTQTIARHAAVIMTDDPLQREALGSELGDLYALRSALVHRGKRNVSSHEAARSQELVETLYRSVLDKFDITRKHSELWSALRKASYGLPWQPDLKSQ